MSFDAQPHPFDDLISQPESDFRLAHAALLWAIDEYPDMRPAHYLDRLNALAERVDQCDAHDGHDRVGALRSVLVEEEDFTGNIDDFMLPGNSYLNRVFDTRRGIPVSLSVLWIDIAQQLGWPIHGVSMPGHFILRHEGVGDELLIDPFNGGRILTFETCQQMAAALFGKEAELTEEQMESVGPRTILARMLGNLYAYHVHKDDWPRAIRILSRVAALRPDDAMIFAEIGRLQTKTNDLGGAARSLTKARELAATDEETSTINHHFVHLRNLLNEQN